MKTIKTIGLVVLYFLYLVAGLIFGISESLWQFLKGCWFEIEYFLKGFSKEEFKKWRDL